MWCSLTIRWLECGGVDVSRLVRRSADGRSVACKERIKKPSPKSLSPEKVIIFSWRNHGRHKPFTALQVVHRLRFRRSRRRFSDFRTGIIETDSEGVIRRRPSDPFMSGRRRELASDLRRMARSEGSRVASVRLGYPRSANAVRRVVKKLRGVPADALGSCLEQ